MQAAVEAAARAPGGGDDADEPQLLQDGLVARAAARAPRARLGVILADAGDVGDGGGGGVLRAELGELLHQAAADGGGLLPPRRAAAAPRARRPRRRRRMDELSEQRTAARGEQRVKVVRQLGVVTCEETFRLVRDRGARRVVADHEAVALRHPVRRRAVGGGELHAHAHVGGARRLALHLDRR